MQGWRVGGWGLWFLMLLQVACGGAQELVAAPQVTYFSDVQPLFEQACTECHRDQGATFSLASYEAARYWGEASLQSIAAQRMPPWQVTTDQSCGDFAGAWQQLDSAQTLLRQWIDAGMPKGERVASQAGQREDAAREVVETSTLEVARGFRPAIQGKGRRAQYHERRCFLWRNRFSKTMYVTGYRYQRHYGDAVAWSALHRVSLSEESERAGVSNELRIRRLHELDAKRAGWPCTHDAGDGVRTRGALAVWTPGEPKMRYPAGSGVRLGADEAVVVEILYDLTQAFAPKNDEPLRVTLQWEDMVAHELTWLWADKFTESLQQGDVHREIPAREEAHRFTWQIALPAWQATRPQLAHDSGELKMIGMLPLMRQFGKRMTVMVTAPEDSMQCGMHVAEWRPGWHRLYRYTEPQSLVAETEFHVNCEWDTQASPRAVQPGWGDGQEVCGLGLLVSVAVQDDADALPAETSELND